VSRKVDGPGLGNEGSQRSFVGHAQASRQWIAGTTRGGCESFLFFPVRLHRTPATD
jgi:hypothetical protein